MIKKKITLIFIVASVLSCGIRPPKNLEPQNLLSYLESINDNLLEMLNNMSMTKILDPTWAKKSVLLFIDKNDFIITRQNPVPKNLITAKTIAFSSEQGFIEVARDIYFSKDDSNDLLYSYDKKIWMSLSGDPREYENFLPNATFSYKKNNNSLVYDFYWTLEQGSKENIFTSKLKLPLDKRRVVDLKPNLFLYNSDNKAEQVNLRENILFVKKGTRSTLNFKLNSNLFDIERVSNNSVKFKFYNDIWIYRNNFVFSVSFDGKDYGHTIFSFNLDFNMFVKTDENNLPEIIYAITFISKNIKSGYGGIW